jgi:hypothetical protein
MSRRGWSDSLARLGPARNKAAAAARAIKDVLIEKHLQGRCGVCQVVKEQAL